MAEQSITILARPELAAALARLARARLVALEDADCVVIGHDPPEHDAVPALARARGRATVVVAQRAFKLTALRAGAHEVLDVEALDARRLDDAIESALARRGGAREGFAQRVLDQLFAFVGVLDTSGVLLDANEAPLRAAGITIEDVRGKPFWDCYWWSYAEDARAKVKEACARAARGETVRYEAVVRMANESRMLIDFQLAPLRNGEGRVSHLVPSGVDITERERAERELRATEARLERLSSTNLLGIIHWDTCGAVREANDEFLRIVGYDRADLERGLIQVGAMGVRAPLETQYRRKDGSCVWVLAGGARIDTDSGVGFVLDISGHKATEAALRESELRAREAAARAEAERSILDAILEAAPAGIIVSSAAGQIVRVNPAHEVLWGPPPPTNDVNEYAQRKNAPSDWAMARALRGEIVRDDIVEIEPFGKPGARRTTVNSGAPVRDKEGRVTGAVVVQMDISALVASEAARRESEARFRDLADNIAQLAWMMDESGFIFWYNRRWFEFTGTKLEDMVGWGWQKVHHPDFVRSVTDKFQRHLASGEPWEDTFPLRSKDGSYRWFLSRAFPLRDHTGRVVSWFGTNTDITAQRQAEEALREADRRKDEFIAILAHELRNPLAPVRSAAALLRLVGSTEARVVRAREVIERQVQHMSRLIDDLLDVSRIARGKLALRRARCDLAEIARQTTEDYRATIEAAGLEVVPPRGEPVWVNGDPVRLAQMIGNLLNNASRFTERGGRVEVSVDQDQGCARVRVADTGIGMDGALLSHLFDPFSQADQGFARTKGGLGLGLALTKDLAELHHGRVTAESAGLGRGSTFTLSIPLARSEPETKEDAPRESAHADKVRVLIVEDNHDAATTLGDLLELQGHEVKLAHDGASALEIARGFRPRVVISDLGLPGALDGYALARALRSEPELGDAMLIALSGYANEDARRRSRDAGFDEHLAKPPDLVRLERALVSAARGP